MIFSSGSRKQTSDLPLQSGFVTREKDVSKKPML
jgi:hypothetical protein